MLVETIAYEKCATTATLALSACCTCCRVQTGKLALSIMMRGLSAFALTLTIMIPLYQGIYFETHQKFSKPKDHCLCLRYNPNMKSVMLVFTL